MHSQQGEPNLSNIYYIFVCVLIYIKFYNIYGLLIYYPLKLLFSLILPTELLLFYFAPENLQ